MQTLNYSYAYFMTGSSFVYKKIWRTHKILGLPPACIMIVMTGLKNYLPEEHAQKIRMSASVCLYSLHQTALNQLYL